MRRVKVMPRREIPLDCGQAKPAFAQGNRIKKGRGQCGWAERHWGADLRIGTIKPRSAHFGMALARLGEMPIEDIGAPSAKPAFGAKME